MNPILIEDRYLGSLLGLAAGDALGTTLEFHPPGTFTPIHDMIGGGPFRLAPGQWTDDTSMALCLAASLIEKHGFDPLDQMQRYVRWWKEGYYTSTGYCFDIGGTTRKALATFQRTGDPYAGVTDLRESGNGSLMRLAPVPLFYARQPAEAIARAADSSRTTHASPLAVDACRYYAALIVGALQGVDKATLLSACYTPVADAWQAYPLHPQIQAIAEGSFKQKEPPEIRGRGFVVDSLEAALWAFASTDDFREGALLAVNLGDDADTTGAIYGQLAGAYYGVDAIPIHWRTQLTMREEIEGLAVRLLALGPDRNAD
jgi:ADP-ribosyl-[dinitrogen reductase] hydrolase